MVEPNQIDVRRHLYDAFDNYETEVSAWYIIRFCQSRNRGWEPFSFDDIDRFYTENGPGDGFLFNRLISRGYVTEDNGLYTVTANFVSRCFKASLETKALTSGTEILANGVRAGQIGQNPNDHRVMNPGLWYATIHTADGGLLSLGSAFYSKSAALAEAFDALAKNWSFAQWQEHLGQKEKS